MARPKAFDEKVVLNQAVDLFCRRGYEATSVQDLVDELGINRASLYDTYGDKYALYRQALEQYRQCSQQTIYQLLDQSRPVIDLLHDFLEGTVNDIISDSAQKGCFMVNAAIELAPHDTEIARLVAQNQQTMVDKFAELIERGQREGDITTRHPAGDLSQFIFNTVSGLRVLGKMQSPAATLQAIVGVVISSLHP
ncbi:TetR/AcrR family transcriptional regulator [Spirosoma areae]